MSTSLLCHAFGLVGYRYLKTEYRDATVLFSIEKKPDKLCCPDCDSREIIRRGLVSRTIKTLPIGKKQVLLVVKIQRVECTECGSLKQEKLNFAEPKKNINTLLWYWISKAAQSSSLAMAKERIA